MVHPGIPTPPPPNRPLGPRGALRFPGAGAGGRTSLSSRNVVLWDFCDTWRIFLLDHIAGRFSCSNVTIRTRRGACGMGVETILLIVILAFAAGVVLDRLVIKRGRFDAAKSKKEQ
jgi:hypothetical protein